jgi:signal transduction histidine kinase
MERRSAARSGIQAEVLTSLGLVMLLSSALLAAMLVAHHERTLRELVGRALVAEARAQTPALQGFVPGTRWWTVRADGRVEPRGPLAGAIDVESRALADDARAHGEPRLRPGALWEEIRIGVPLDAAGAVAVAALPREASVRLRAAALGVVGGVVAVNVAIFAALGAFVLRRRVVSPLQRLAAVARALAAGDAGARAPVDGTAETAALARAMNEMSESLEQRTLALEKAVVDLREANADLRRARHGLARAERLAAVGRLAAGVAHEIGNPIGAILALVDLAARDPALGEDARGHLARASREGTRVREILRQLLDFSRPPRASVGPVDLAAVAEEVVALVAAQRRYAGVAFRVAPAPGTPTARGDASAVTQILLNLALNAADACAGCDAPRVELLVRAAAGARRAGDPPDAPPPPRRRADAVECVVADDGAGIDPADRERIFDPFFTTKPPGEGTGLGLPNAALLAEEQGGALELVEPPAGLRTAFALRLPVFEPASGDAAARGSGAPSGAAQGAAGCASDFAARAADRKPAAGQSSSGPAG